MPPLSEASRPLMWNIDHVWVMYALFAAALVVFAFGAYRRIEFWRRGKPDRESACQTPDPVLSATLSPG